MIRAASLAAFSALLGGAIALLARRYPSLLERTRTFAFAAAAGVVAFHLLPEVLPAQGPAALFWIAAGFALPWALEAGARVFGPRVLRGRGFSGLRVSAEVGFAALIFHSLVEGLALVAALAQPGSKADLEIALVAHHAPLTAAVVLPFLEIRGARMVGVRAALIGVAGACGALASVALPGFSEGAFLQKAIAVTAGALLHVVSDEIRVQRFSSRWERAADIGACAAGLCVAGLGAVLHMRQQGLAGPFIEFLRAAGGLALAAAPALLVGAIAVALSPLRGFRWDAFLLALVLLGPAAALLLGAGSLVVMRGPPHTLLQHVRDRGPPLLALLLAAAALHLGGVRFAGSTLEQIVLMVVVALAARLDQAGAVILAAVLAGSTLDPDVALMLLAAGPLVSRTWRGPGIFAFAVMSAAAIACERKGWLVPHTLAGFGAPVAAQAAAAPLSAAAAAVLVALALATLWTAGARGWFAPLRHGPQAAS